MRSQTAPISASGAAGYNVLCGYDVRGLQLYARFSSDSGAGITNTYDGFGRLRLSSSNIGGVTRNVTSDYNAHGNRTRITLPDGAWFEHAYDRFDRLIHLSRSSQTQASLGRRGTAPYAQVALHAAHCLVARSALFVLPTENRRLLSRG